MSWLCPPSLLPVDEGFAWPTPPKGALKVPKLCAQALGPLLSPPPLDQTGLERHVCPLGMRDFLLLASHRKSK